MIDFVQKNIAIKDLQVNKGQIKDVPKNPRFIRDKRFEKLVQSIKELPDMLELRELIVYDYYGQLIVIGGNMRLRAMKQLGMQEAPCKILAQQTPHGMLKQIAIKDNVAFGEDDMDLLSSEWELEDLTHWGMDIQWTLGEMSETEQAEKPDDAKAAEDEEGFDEHYFDDDEDENIPETEILDVLYDSDNDFEIPNLRLDMQAGQVELPLTAWGANTRLRKDVSTYHFYIDDYKFEKLWKDPYNLLVSGCKAIIEPNCSCHDQTPIAYGLSLIYKKRWLARRCQEEGIKVYADLNVATKFMELNKLGIPKGYNAFATRGSDGFINWLEENLKVAQEISGLERPNLIVYSGGKQVQKFCQKHGLVYLQGFMNSNEVK